MLTIDSDSVKSVGIHFSYVQDPKIRIFNLYDNSNYKQTNEINDETLFCIEFLGKDAIGNEKQGSVFLNYNQANDLINQLNGSIELIKLERLKIDPKVLSENDCA